MNRCLAVWLEIRSFCALFAIKSNLPFSHDPFDFFSSSTLSFCETILLIFSPQESYFADFFVAFIKDFLFFH